MQFLQSFTLPTDRQEADFYCEFYQPKLDMSCYSGCVYPFKIFPQKGLEKLDFGQITMLYGTNGSGKSTLLNVIAQKLKIAHKSPWNNMPCFEDYVKLCRAHLNCGEGVPSPSRIITSDDVFDYLLENRSFNERTDRDRNELFKEYYRKRDDLNYKMKSLEYYDEMKDRYEIMRGSLSKYAGRRMAKELAGKSNGESAFIYFTKTIDENALYLLDEPENSLSAALQLELADFISDSARFYGCQFIISTHSPFLLSMKGSVVYDLDSNPVVVKRWSELENIRAYYRLFHEHSSEFDI